VRALVQRVSQAAVDVEGERVSQIGPGMLVLLGVARGDKEEDADRLADKVRALRIFDDAEGRMNEPLGDREVLCVSQFTLYGDARKGNRPSYADAAPAEQAEPLYDRFCERLGAARGVFGARMGIALVNDGPVTLLVESSRRKKNDNIPAEGELEDGARFIRFEYQMLDRAAQIWRDKRLNTHSKSNKWERRRVTEVFLLHMRNLMDFMAPRPSLQPGDVVATHYRRSWRRSEDDLLAGLSIAEWRSRIDKLLSHVTYNRREIMEEADRSSRWPIEEIHRDLTRSLGDFLSAVPEARRKWFDLEI
jgi:D-tyrosyl-tRNA(Tyr) deacylase